MSLTAIREVDYVILPCNDLAAARAFYRDVMGFPLEEDHPEWVRFRLGTSFLTLRPRGPWLCWHDGAKAADAVAVQLAFRVSPDEVLACHQELVAKGVEILDPPKDQAFGHRTLFFRDPESNVLEIFAEIA